MDEKVKARQCLQEVFCCMEAQLCVCTAGFLSEFAVSVEKGGRGMDE